MAGSSFLQGNTLMTNSVVGDAWIREVCAANPVSMLPGEGRLISSGPVRLAFCETLFEPKAPTGNPGATPKYSVCALYSPFSDLSLYYSEYYRVCGEMFPDYYNPNLNPPGYSGLENPFHDCAQKAHKFEGFTPGLMYINHTSKFKPSIVDASPQKNLINDKAKVYPGVWAILVVNAYGYGKSPPQPKKGVSYGLQAVMIIGNDQNLSGGGIDPREAFKGAVVKPPTVNPAALAGIVPPPAGAAPYAPPMTGMAPGWQAPRAPSSGFTPPPPPNPLYSGMARTTPAEDAYDISSLM
jgi:hypothetical protein